MYILFWRAAIMIDSSSEDEGSNDECVVMEDLSTTRAAPAAAARRTAALRLTEQVVESTQGKSAGGTVTANTPATATTTSSSASFSSSSRPASSSIMASGMRLARPVGAGHTVPRTSSITPADAPTTVTTAGSTTTTTTDIADGGVASAASCSTTVVALATLAAAAGAAAGAAAAAEPATKRRRTEQQLEEQQLSGASTTSKATSAAPDTTSGAAAARLPNCKICTKAHRRHALLRLGCGCSFGKACLTETLTAAATAGRVPACPDFDCGDELYWCDLLPVLGADAVAQLSVEGADALRTFLKKPMPCATVKLITAAAAASQQPELVGRGRKKKKAGGCKAISRGKRDTRGVLKKGTEVTNMMVGCQQCSKTLCTACGSLYVGGGHGGVKCGCPDSHLAQVHYALSRLDLLFAELQGGSTKVRASKKKAPAKGKGSAGGGGTAWAKGTGFGGAATSTTSHFGGGTFSFGGGYINGQQQQTKAAQSDALKKQKAATQEAKQDGEIVEILGMLTAAFQAFSKTGFGFKEGSAYNGAAGLLCLENLTHSSQLDGLLVLLLRNDSLMDITTNRADVYAALLAFLTVLCLDQCGALGASILVGLCPFRGALQQLKRKAADAAVANNSSNGGGGGGGGSTRRGAAAGGHAKRKATAADIVDSDGNDNAGSAYDEDERTPVFRVLEQLDKQCKVFIKQTKKATGSDDLSSVDPRGLARAIREVHTQVTAAIAKMPRAFASLSNVVPQEIIDITGDGAAASASGKGKGKGKATAGGGGGGGATAASKEDAVYDNEKASYIGEIKSLQFRMAKMEHEHHAHYTMILASSAMMGTPDRMRRITREMSSLSSSLPLEFGSSIFVRVDESRCDVLKALIIGPEDTPYANGCFTFDIFLPAQYPNAPPKVQLQTTGRGRVRFNPNLYANGKVCLSLLGTWQGPGWDAKHSTVLQVLLSIQSLILVDQPYFNEPGFETRPESKTACAMYNQALKYHTMETAILGNLKNPDPAFNSVIRTHFRCKKAHILRDCKKWAEEAAAVDKLAKAKKTHHVHLHDLGAKTASALTTMADSVEAALSELNVETVTLE